MIITSNYGIFASYHVMKDLVFSIVFNVHLSFAAKVIDNISFNYSVSLDK